MTVVRDEAGYYYVIDKSTGKRLSPLCNTENQAWNWMDKLA